MDKKFRIQLNEWELRILRNLLAVEYRCKRRNLRYEKNRIQQGQPDRRVYPFAEQQKALKEYARLLKKLSRQLKDEKWFYR